MITVLREMKMFYRAVPIASMAHRIQLLETRISLLERKICSREKITL
jgi:hypothetical protein